MATYRIPFVMHGVAEIEAQSIKEARRIFEEMYEENLIGFVKVIDYETEDEQ